MRLHFIHRRSTKYFEMLSPDEILTIELHAKKSGGYLAKMPLKLAMLFVKYLDI
jgi:hypothetical protein